LADWVTISSLATAGGTLVLAAATFGSVRSANRSARVAERSLLAGQRPVLVPSREDDPLERVMFGDGQRVTLHGHGGVIEVAEGRIYMAMGVPNAGAGLAVLHGWLARARDELIQEHAPELDDFHRQLRDLYIPAGDAGFWQGAIRDPEDVAYAGLLAAAQDGGRVVVDLLYGDHEGGQRAIARFGVTVEEEGAGRTANVLRYWNLDREDPR
jgi:hypothetical protein